MPLRVALVSDTHLPRFGRSLPAPLLDGFAAHRIDRILHAGDWTELLAADLLEAIAPLDGVAGNNDGAALRERFGDRRIIELEGARIAITHGHLGRGSSTPERARRTFESEGPLDAIVFGHSHIPFLERMGSGTWLVNPGSPTDRRAQRSYSWGLMTIDAGAISGLEIIRFGGRPPDAPPWPDDPATAPSTRGARRTTGSRSR